MKKASLYIILFLGVLFVGCKKYLDVNRNIDAPDYAEAYLYLANIQQQYQGNYWDIRAIGPLSQMMGTSSYTTFANNYYSAGSDAGGEVWRMVYWNQGMNLENLINQSEEAGNWTLAGIGYAMKAFSWDIMTKQHGELPMKEAYLPDQLSHNYDYQDEIYEQVRKWAYKAIELLEKDDATQYGTKISANDFIYRGDKAKWIKFAYAVIVRNLASLTNKDDFVAKYASELIAASDKAFQSSDDDAYLTVAGGSQSAPFSTYNNFWGTARGNLSNVYWQHDFAVQAFTGTVPKYNESTGERIRSVDNARYPYELMDKQIITDTLRDVTGHFDPRMVVKLATTSNPNYNSLGDPDTIKSYRYLGSSFTSASGSIGTAPSFYGRTQASTFTGPVNDGIGRWIYRDDAPYILMTFAELRFCLAETYWKMGEKAKALSAFKDGVKADINFTEKFIFPGKEGSPTGGDKITKALFRSLANEYLAGPYVDQLQLSDFTLSHIMMQKYNALFPWGAQEAWVDLRKYHYDINYTGDYPSNGNGWTDSQVDQKWDSDPDKVYKGFFLAPAQVEGRKVQYNINNAGSPSYRLRPRYNSEYMWNLKSLEELRPISGTAPNYQTSIPWFAYPGDMPK